MNLADITSKCYIMALIIRDDGERLLLGEGYYEFKSNLQHFQPNTYQNDVVELQGTDGQLLAGQVRRTSAQKFDGYIGDASVNKTTIEQYRTNFMMFFRKKHFYKVVYIMPNGDAIQRKRGYITDAPSVPEIWQKFPEYHIALNFEDPNYYEYEEDENGDEIFANIVNIVLAIALSGGLIWDNDGAVSDNDGYEWEDGAGKNNIATVTGVDNAYPVWQVIGPAENPTLTNTTTGQTITWTGIVPNNQTLTIDMANMTASLEGANVFEFITGEWLYLQPGNNRITYTASGGATADSILSWNGVVS